MKKLLQIPAISYVIHNKVHLELPATNIEFPYSAGCLSDNSAVVIKNKNQLLIFLQSLEARLLDNKWDIFLCHELGASYKQSIGSMLDSLGGHFNTLNNVLGEALVDSFYSLPAAEANHIRAQIVRGIITTVSSTKYSD